MSKTSYLKNVDKEKWLRNRHGFRQHWKQRRPSKRRKEFKSLDAERATF